MRYGTAAAAVCSTLLLLLLLPTVLLYLHCYAIKYYYVHLRSLQTNKDSVHTRRYNNIIIFTQPVDHHHNIVSGMKIIVIVPCYTSMCIFRYRRWLRANKLDGYLQHRYYNVPDSVYLHQRGIKWSWYIHLYA